MSGLVSDDESVAQWVQSARSDLAYAEIDPPVGVMFEPLCFHAQQAAEKAIKALLLAHDEEPPYIHDIGALVALLQTKVAVPEGVADAAALTPYAAWSGYPPSGEPVTDEQWRDAAAIARRVVEWVEQQLAAP